MPNYWNPNNFYPATYPQMYGTPMVPQQPMSGASVQPQCVMTWVPDEMEARGKSMPQGCTQFAMWDSNQPKIYLKSINQMGMPNPMQVLHYTIEEAQASLPAGQSGATQPMPDMSQYATHDEIEQLRNEINRMHEMQQSASMAPALVQTQTPVQQSQSQVAGHQNSNANEYGVTRSQNRGGNK